MTVITSLTSSHRSRVLAAVGACLVSFACFWAAQRAAHVSLIDLRVYRAEGATVRAGGDLYALRTTSAHLPSTYPPFAALLFTVLTVPGRQVLGALVMAGNLALLVVFVALSLRLAGHTRPAGHTRVDGHARKAGHARVETIFWVSAVAVWCEPVWTTLRYGQINLLIGVLVLADLVLVDPAGRSRRRWAGAGIGIAAAIKLTPGLFAVWLLIAGVVAHLRKGRAPGTPSPGAGLLRQAGNAVGGFTAATLLAAAVLPYDSWRFWTGMVFRTDRVGETEDSANQALRGVLARLLHTPEPTWSWLVPAAVVGAGGMAMAVVAETRGRRAWAVVTCAVTALLISPVSWSHHWVWCVPLVLMLRAEGRRTAALWTGAVFLSYALWLVPHEVGRPELGLDPVGLTLSALYAVTALALLALAWASLRTSDTTHPNHRGVEAQLAQLAQRPQRAQEALEDQEAQGTQKAQIEA